MGGDPPAGEVPFWLPPPGVPEDGRHGPLTTIGHYMGISTHWGGAGDGGTRRYWGVYLSPPEHGRTTHCNSSYHILVSGGGAEAGDAALAEMVVAACSRYPSNNSGACGSKYGISDMDGGVGGREMLVYGRVEQGRMTRGTIYFHVETWWRLGGDLAETWWRLGRYLEEN